MGRTRAFFGVVTLTAALSGVACGGGAASERPVVTHPPPAPPIDRSVAAGWAAIDEPEFFARIPDGFARRDTVSEGGPAVQWSATKDGVTFTVARRPLGEGADTERAFDAASSAFFRACRGARVRMEHADTLEHKTVTVDGSCGANKPAMGQIHVRGTNLFELFIVVDGGSAQAGTEELRGFFRAFRVKSS